MTTGVPFNERGGALRGVLDLAAGRYPSFLFGGSLGDLLPAFHFHEVSTADLAPKLEYLAENGYRTLNADEVAAYVRGAEPSKGRRVALCFDDAWSSLWTVAGPLLKKYGFTASAYAIPARIDDAAGCRPTADGAVPGASDSPFVTWPELRSL